MRLSVRWVVVATMALGGAACGKVRGGAETDGGTSSEDPDARASDPDAAPSGPNLVVSPTDQIFGSVVVGTTSDPEAFTFRNNGNEAVTGCSAPELSGDHPNDFEIIDDNCAFADLAPSDTCVVTVSAAPQLEGSRSATLSRTCEAGGTASTDINGLNVNKPMVIFVSSTTYDGNLGGFEGADATCSALAGAGSLTGDLDNTWKALLSKSTGGVVHARDRFDWTGPMFDVFGNLVTLDPAVWPWIDGGDNSEIEFNESGGGPGDSYSLSGTTLDGLSQGDGLDCNGWTSASMDLATIAGATKNYPAEDWLEAFDSDCAEDFFAIYCISQ